VIDVPAFLSGFGLGFAVLAIAWCALVGIHIVRRLLDAG
jgi:hypothetical protein